MTWDELCKKSLTGKGSAVSLTLSAGLRLGAAPMMCLLVKIRSDGYYASPWITLNKSECAWLVTKAFVGMDEVLESRNKDKEVTRSLRVQYLERKGTKTFHLVSKRKDKNNTTLSIPGACIDEFLEALSAMLRRFNEFVNSLKPADIADFEIGSESGDEAANDKERETGVLDN